MSLQTVSSAGVPGSVSVCVLTTDDASRLDESIASIIGQTHSPSEILVCDVAPSPQNVQIVANHVARDSRVRLVRVSDALAHESAFASAIRDANGEFVAVYRADCVYDPTIVERQIRALEKDHSFGAVFVVDRFLAEEGKSAQRARVSSDLSGRSNIDCAALTTIMLSGRNDLLSSAAAMVRRDICAAAGGFDEQSLGSRAVDALWLAIVRSGPIGLIQEPLLTHWRDLKEDLRRRTVLRTSRDPFFRMMDYHLSQPKVREGIAGAALLMYRVDEAQDETGRAANALLLGDTIKARAIMQSSVVKSLLRTKLRGKALRILALKATVFASAAMGGPPISRKLIYAARFRRKMPRDTKSAADSTDNVVAHVPHRPTAKTISVYLDPHSYHFLGNGLFDDQSKWNRDGSLRPWLILRERLSAEGIRLNTADYFSAHLREDKSVKVYSSFGMLDRYRELAARDDVLLNSFYLFEVVMYAQEMYARLPELSKDFRTVYSWTDHESLARFAPEPFSVSDCRMPAPFSAVIERHWNRTDRRGVLFVYTNRRGIPIDGNLLDERMEGLAYFSSRGEAELWGRWWDDLSRIHPRFAEPIRRSWRGPLADKYEAYGRARFVFCCENMSMRGWITEKIFDCFYSGAVPMYLGAPDVLDWIPADCFIDLRAFKSYSELGRFIDDLTPADIEKYRLAGRDYLESAAFRPFSAEAFADRFIGDVRAQLEERGLAGALR
ncbi:MAG: glycosyltransferase [Gemmatimonadales bacterium]